MFSPYILEHVYSEHLFIRDLCLKCCLNGFTSFRWKVLIVLEIGYILTQNPVDTVWGEISSLTNPHTRRPLRRGLIMVIDPPTWGPLWLLASCSLGLSSMLYYLACYIIQFNSRYLVW